jgi:hypothetical protein
MKDLIQAKTFFYERGYPIRLDISMNDFIQYLLEHPFLNERLFDGINTSALSNLHPCEIPSLKLADKISTLIVNKKKIIKACKKNEKYSSVSEEDILALLMFDYLKETARIDSNRSLSFFDFFTELANSLRILQSV